MRKHHLYVKYWSLSPTSDAVFVFHVNIFRHRSKIASCHLNQAKDFQSATSDLSYEAPISLFLLKNSQFRKIIDIRFTLSVCFNVCPTVLKNLTKTDGRSLSISLKHCRVFWSDIAHLVSHTGDSSALCWFYFTVVTESLQYAVLICLWILCLYNFFFFPYFRWWHVTWHSNCNK